MHTERHDGQRRHADSVNIDNGIGAVVLSGSMWVSPLETTTYTITAAGPGGTASESVMVTVTSAPAPIATFTADPGTIIAGESSTLSWTTQNADSVSIDQGIGAVGISGSISVSPGETITYTLTATGAGGTVTQSVTVTINPLPQPTVTITADPASIITGESTTLTWSSTAAADAAIDQGIGTVPLSGSTIVSPATTTTYTITVTGPGGTATDSVTVIVNFPAPTAGITANPQEILAGESSTLSWSSSNADSCIIEPEIGNVATEGSISVTPGQTTTYTLSVTGPGGTGSASATITVISPISLRITSPEDGETLSTSDVAVKGTITNLNGNETGVVVDGMPAQLYDGQFFINHLPLEDGSNTITVVVTDASGAQVTQEILLFADLPSDYIRIHASLEAGLPPMETELYVRGSFSLSTPAIINSSGPGPITFIESGIDQFYVSFSTAGIYYITATATDEDGISFTDTIMLLVMDRDLMDALLSAKWNGMVESLNSGDTVAASEYFSSAIQENYAEKFNLVEGSASGNCLQLSRFTTGKHNRK